MTNFENFDVVGGSNNLDISFSGALYHDGSGYYNYEEDNLPLERLVGRTDLLHQFVGYPGDEDSKATTLILSSTADEANGIFDNMTDIVKRIPQRLTFPLLIEIADFGDLGSLDLRDINTFGSGQLEVKNLIHGYEASAIIESNGTSSLNSLTDNEQITNTTGKRASDSNIAVSGVSAVDTSNGFMSQLTSAATSRGSISVWDASQFSSVDANQVANTTAFLTQINSTDKDLDKLYFSKGGRLVTTDKVALTPYQGVYDNSIHTDDIAPREDSGANNTNLEFSRDQSAASDNIAISVYGNFFRSVTVNGCSGKIKITNVCVDGASGLDNTADALSHNTDHGFDITNSEVILQNCASARNRVNAFRVRNSDIFVAGNMYGYRSYQRETSKSRTTSYESAGLYSVNSNIVFSDSALGITGATGFNKFNIVFSKCDYGIRLKRSYISGGTKLATGSDVPNGGDSDTTTCIVSTFQNKKAGLFLEGSEMSLYGRLNSFNNRIGLKTFQSTISLNQFTLEDNQDEGILLDSSKLIYGYREDESTASVLPDSTTGKKRTTFNVSNNGVNAAILKSSSLQPYEADDIAYETYIGKWGGREVDIVVAGSNAMVSHGSTSQSQTFRDLPSVIVSNNSVARLINPAIVRKADGVGKGRCILADKDSTVYLHGTSVSPVVMSLSAAGSTWASDQLFYTWNSAAVCADNNSRIVLTGRTKITRFGVAGLALGGSVIEFTTPSKYGANTPETTKFNLDASANHSQVQIHSTRACLVASRDSGIVFDHLGGTPDSYSNADGKSTDIKYNTDAEGSAADNGVLWDNATSGAYIQFFPNGFAKQIALTDTKAFYDLDSVIDRSVLNDGLFIASGSHGDATTGGMVVRTVGGSYVDLNAANILFAVDASTVSGAVYNYTGSGHEYNGIEPGCPQPGTASDAGIISGISYPPQIDDSIGDPSSWQFSYSGFDECYHPGLDTSAYELSAYGTQIHIWNIADTSRIVAKNVKLNGNDSYDESSSIGYHGPAGKWRNGAALDYYGIWGTATTYHSTADNKFRNYGPYRLMLSHRGDVKNYYGLSAMNSVHGTGTYNFGYTGSGVFIDQSNAQGYQFFTAQAKPFNTADGLATQWSRPSQLSEGSLQGLYQTSSADTIFGFGLPSPASGVASFIQPPIAAYYARDYTDTGTFDVTGALTTNIVNIMQATPNFAIPPVHMDWQGYLRNWLDDSASNIFANAKHLAMKQVNGISIFHSYTGLGGEGRGDDALGATYGYGVRSLNLFDLDNLL